MALVLSCPAQAGGKHRQAASTGRRQAQAGGKHRQAASTGRRQAQAGGKHRQAASTGRHRPPKVGKGSPAGRLQRHTAAKLTGSWPAGGSRNRGFPHAVGETVSDFDAAPRRGLLPVSKTLWSEAPCRATYPYLRSEAALPGDVPVLRSGRPAGRRARFCGARRPACLRGAPATPPA
jgi:hypothetical protein